MKKIILLAAAVIFTIAPAMGQKIIIPVSTDNMQILLSVRKNGSLWMEHFGAPVSDPQEFLGYSFGRSVWPEAYPAVGGTFIGEPALHVKYSDGYHNTELRYVSHETTVDDGVTTTGILLRDKVSALEVKLVFRAHSKENVIAEYAEIMNAGKKPVELLGYASSSISLDSDKYFLTHFHGDWAAEMQPVGELLDFGTKVIESRRGTQGTQTENPSFLISLGTDSLQEDQGEVVAGALRWSGNFRIGFEKNVSGRLSVIAGISPFASTITLGKGKSFTTPEMLWTYSREGAGGASRNLHRWARKYGIWGGGAVNPTLLNSWEGAYFDFDTATLTGMIDDAASMGLEMFVLDDGWFGTKYPRNSDRTGLGDWEPNTEKIPEGIEYLAGYAHSKGIKFGIWIEPEMVSRISALAQEHPEWVVKSPGREIYEVRHQWSLDLTNPKVQDFVFGIFDRTMQLAPGIDYIKWDCNRAINSFGSEYLGKEQDRFYVEYVKGLYSVMDRIREKYPRVIIQCCSSGGARVDYGAMSRCNEFWTSDNTDAISRAVIQYGTSFIYPACAMASHVSAVPNHQSGNVTPLKMRFDMAAAGRLGMELQPKTLSEEERAFAVRCIESYKGFRNVVFTGDLYRLSSPLDSDFYSFLYVNEDKTKAVVFEFCLKYQNRESAGHTLRLKGLDPAKTYKVTEQNVDRSCWWGNGKTFHGDFLMEGGFNPRLVQSGASAIFVLEAK